MIKSYVLHMYGLRVITAISVLTVILYYFSLRTMRLCLSNGFVSFSFVRMDNINNTNHLHTLCYMLHICLYSCFFRHFS